MVFCEVEGEILRFLYEGLLMVICPDARLGLEEMGEPVARSSSTSSDITGEEPLLPVDSE